MAAQVAEGAQALGVGGHGPLRVPGRPRGEEEVRDVARRHGAGPGHRRLRRDPVRGAQEVVPSGGLHSARRGPVGASRPAPGSLVAQDDGPPELSQVLADQQPGIVHPQEPPHGEQGASARRPQDVGRLGSLEPGVEGDQHHAGPEDAESGHHPLGTIRAPRARPAPPA